MMTRSCADSSFNSWHYLVLLKLTNISVSSHGESYEYNSGYSPSNGDPIIDFGKEVIGNTNWEAYNVVGATVTTNSMKEAYKVALDYLAQKEGK